MLTSKNPFEGKTKEVTLKKILTGKLALPSYLDAQTHSLLKGDCTHALACASQHAPQGYCTKTPSAAFARCIAALGPSRISADVVFLQAVDIKSHSFFKGVKWDKMLELSIPPPFVPDIDGPSSLKYVRPKYLEQVRLPLSPFPHFFDALPQPAVETPVFDSPLAQRVREEGATLFVGFSFERPSLLLRRRSRPHHVPVEDCFMGLDFSAESQDVAVVACATQSLAGDSSSASAMDCPSERIAVPTTDAAAAASAEAQWFDIPPPEDTSSPSHSSPDYYDVEEDILRGGHPKQGGAGFGGRPKASSSIALKASQRQQCRM